MTVICEISNPHYHPGPGFKMQLTKRRHLSVPPYWVANERLEHEGKSYAIIMPARSKELWEDFQPPHIHVPKSFPDIGPYCKGHVPTGQIILFKVKREPYEFGAVAHFDNMDAEQYGIKSHQVMKIEKL